MEINTKLHKHINKFTSILNSENKLEITYRFTDKTREKITKASNTTRNQSSCFSYGLKCEREFHFYVLLLTFGKKEICMWNCVNTLLCSKQFPKVSLNVIIIVGSFTAITSSTFYLRVVEGKKCGAEGRQRRITKWKKNTHTAIQNIQTDSLVENGCEIECVYAKDKLVFGIRCRFSFWFIKCKTMPDNIYKQQRKKKTEYTSHTREEKKRIWGRNTIQFFEFNKNILQMRAVIPCACMPYTMGGWKSIKHVEKLEFENEIANQRREWRDTNKTKKKVPDNSRFLYVSLCVVSLHFNIILTM